MYVLLFHEQNVRYNHNIKLGNKSFESVTKFKYLGGTLTHQYYMLEETKSGLNSRNAIYHSIQNLSFSHLLTKNMKIEIYRTVICPCYKNKTNKHTRMYVNL